MDETLEIPDSIIRMLASREHRLHHYLWHQVRNTWNQLTEKEQKEISKLGWQPPRPALDKSETILKDNDSGKDFLYMHMKMVQWINRELKKIRPQSKEIQGWESIPPPDDKAYPVPPGRNLAKSTGSYERLAKEEKHLKDPAYLKSISLGQLGSEIEFGVHNLMHIRWAEPATKPRPRIDVTSPSPQIGEEWDDVSYNNLGDPYSSHVNPIFWKIHGWVNNRIEDWKKANPNTPLSWPKDWPKNEIDPATTLNSSLVGNRADQFSSQHAMPHSSHNMMQVFGILAKSGHCKDFYSDFPVVLLTDTPRSRQKEIEIATASMTSAEKKAFNQQIMRHEKVFTGVIVRMENTVNTAVQRNIPPKKSTSCWLDFFGCGAQSRIDYLPQDSSAPQYRRKK